MIQFVLYNLFILVFLPFIVVYLLIRAFVVKQSVVSMKEQLGLVEKEKSGGAVWIHAVSVGETVASSPVVNLLAERRRSLPIVFSTTTRSGHEQAKKSISAEGYRLIYYPYDFLVSVLLSVVSVSPRVFASTDTEIWPNFRYILKLRGSKSAIINGIISDGTLKGARLVSWLYRWTIKNIDLFCMQSEEDARRVIALGADPSCVFVTGNCKADVAAEDMSDDERRALKQGFFGPGSEDAPVFVAGSTNPGEDEPVIEAWLEARKQVPGLRLLIAPRQTARGEEVGEMLRTRGVVFARRTDASHGPCDALVLDTMGELARAYFAGDVSFVGGSLIRKGCHSLLQPVAAGIGVCYGPYTFKTKDIASQTKAFGVGFEIRSSRELAENIVRILQTDGVRDEIREGCRRMMEYNRGAAAKTCDRLLALYDSSMAVQPACSRILRGEKLLSGESKTPQALLFRIVMYPLSLLYRLVHYLYLLPYETGLRKKFRAPVPVVSVGNITMGGTGKTPVTVRLVNLLKEKGVRCCVLSRGYGRNTEEDLIIEPGSEPDALRCGDEPLLLSRLTGVPVVVGRDRRQTARLAIERFAPDALLMDDAMQFWQMHRDLEIIVVSSSRPFSGGLTIPAGDLRESVRAFRRGDVVLSLGSEPMSDRDRQRILRIAPKIRICDARTVTSCVEFAGGRQEPGAILKDKRVFAFCGIANPTRFLGSLKELGAVVEGSRLFLDHHKYSAGDLEGIEAAAAGCDLMITTQKDICRLPGGYGALKGVCTLNIAAEINGEDEILSLIMKELHRE
ncbi:MAG: tetraacyldisaccharide 4'-kinase [Abditibacteriota bacterium]|nr:tetraacyldisaccharide 4'-kinase [Abditibacteriota bacterium]